MSEPFYHIKVVYIIIPGSASKVSSAEKIALTVPSLCTKKIYKIISGAVYTEVVVGQIESRN